MKNFIITGIMFFTACIFLTTGCGESSTNSKSDTTTLALDYPKGGETLSFGDTITISFRANGDSINNVRIQVTTDKGKHYFHIINQPFPITGSGTNPYTQKWIIGKEDEYNINFLYKDTVFDADEDPAWKCKIKIYAQDSKHINMTSDNFTVNFKIRYYLRYPIGGEIYKSTDTIPIIYTFRTDSMSTIQYFYWSLESHYWSQITYMEIPRQGDYQLQTFTRKFIPANPNNIDPIGDSTKIMIDDYSTINPMPLESGWITINKN